MDPIHQGFLHLFQGRIFAKWKRFKGAVFEGNRTGRARLELYSSDSQLSSLRPAKTVVLAECLAIRIVSFEKSDRIIQIQQRNASVLLIAVEDIERWHYVLCKAAFPDQFLAIGTEPCSSRVTADTNDEYDTPWDLNQLPVLLQCDTGTQGFRIPEGNYDIYFGESIMLKNGLHCVQAWAYPQVTGIQTGDSCFMIEIDGIRRCEFKCSRPWNAVEGLRSHLKLKLDKQPKQGGIKNAYNSCYSPYALRNAEEKNISQNKSKNSSFSGRNSQKIKIPFFGGSERTNQNERSKFETNANHEWIRYRRESAENIFDARTPRTNSAGASDISDALRLKEQLGHVCTTKQKLCSSKSYDLDMPPEPKIMMSRISVIPENELPFRASQKEDNKMEFFIGNRPPRLRESVASEPSTSPTSTPITGRCRQSFID